MEYRWFAVQTTAGHENKVRTLLQKRIEEDPRAAEQKLVRQALVPVQEAIEIKNGKKVVVERKLYPGYVLIETTMSQEAQHLVNSVQGVIKFVGTGKAPQPLRQEEVNRLLGGAEGDTAAGPQCTACRGAPSSGGPPRRPSRSGRRRSTACSASPRRPPRPARRRRSPTRSEEHTSELQSRFGI